MISSEANLQPVLKVMQKRSGKQKTTDVSRTK